MKKLVLIALLAYLPAMAQQGSTVLEFTNDNDGFRFHLTYSVPVDSIAIQLSGGQDFDFVRNESHPFTEVPELGVNNDDLRSSSLTLVFDPPLPAGEQFFVAGDIDYRGLNAVTVTLMFSDSATVTVNLVHDAAANEWSGEWRGDFGPPPEPPMLRIDQSELVGFVGDEVTISWCQSVPPAPDFSQIIIHHRETGLIAKIVTDLPGDVTEYKWTPERTGHYWSEIRACINDDPDTADVVDMICSEYTSARDPDELDCQGQPEPPDFPNGWYMYFKIKPPTEGSIE